MMKYYQYVEQLMIIQMEKYIKILIKYQIIYYIYTTKQVPNNVEHLEKV